MWWWRRLQPDKPTGQPATSVANPGPQPDPYAHTHSDGHAFIRIPLER